MGTEMLRVNGSVLDDSIFVFPMNFKDSIQKLEKMDFGSAILFENGIEMSVVDIVGFSESDLSKITSATNLFCDVNGKIRLGTNRVIFPIKDTITKGITPFDTRTPPSSPPLSPTHTN